MGRPRQPSVEPADDADELALDADVVVELRRVGRVRRLEADPVLLLEEALQGDRVLLDLGDDDVAVAGRGCGRIRTKSPSAMCASIIESPRTFRT